jgi:photosystem II stability/assembly factor-like uncharacterized protein
MLLIGTDEGIYRWAEGNGWPVFHSLQDRVVVGLASAGKGSLVAIDDTGLLWESADTGLNWRNLAVPDGAGTPTSMGVAAKPGSIVIATKPLSLYQRSLGARLYPAKPFLTTVLESAESLSSMVRLAAESRKGGGTAVAARPSRPKPPVQGWKKLGLPAGVQGGSAFRLLHLGASAWFAALEGAGLWRSTNQGGAWTKLNAPAAEVVTLRPLPGAEGGLVAATAAGVWFSTDHGDNWTEQSNGLDAAKVVRVVEANPSDPKSLLLAANTQPGAAAEGDALFESEDGGKTWKRIVRSFPENPRFDRVIDIRFDPTHADNIAVAFASGELWMTRNGGGYWQPFARQIKAARALCPVC